MAPGQQSEPLFQRPPSQTSGDSAGLEEEDALLTGQNTGKAPLASAPRRKWREIGLFVWAVVATAVVVVLAVLFQHNQQTADGERASKSSKRNLIFMVSDGMGPTSLSLTRSWRQYTDGLPWDETLILDDHLIGQSRTRSTSSLVTDSAAGATAFSCGLKSYNGAISVLPDHEPCGSVMEAAKRMGYTTGLVVTTRITDATPAVFASHVRRREMEDDIARQLIGDTHPLGRMVDLMMGGGRCHFLPNTTDGTASCRADDLNIVTVAEEKGWKYIDSKQDFDNIGTSVKLPLLALVASRDIPYEIDRVHQEDVYPSLEAMTKTALRVLDAATQDSDKGFFIMIEGSRIDHAGHANDPAAQVHEVLAYDRAMSAVLDFIEHSSTPTLMVSTSDHETGGLATARQLHEAYPHYLWYPSVLANVSQSAAYTAHEYHTRLRTVPGWTSDSTPLSAAAKTDLAPYLTTLASKNLGIHDASTDELAHLLETPALAAYTFADMVSRRAQTGWSTHGHSGADVNIYTSDPIAARALRGNRENTDVGAFLRNYLDLDDEVAKVTDELKAHSARVGAESWLGTTPDEGERLDGQDHLEHYTGDHKKRSSCGLCGV